MRSSGRIFAIALMFPVALAVSLPAPAAAQSAMVAGEVPQAELLEPRWLPWLGCWELTADVVDNRQIEDTGRRVVCVAPRLDGLGVNLTTHMDSQVIAQNTVVADGQERVLPETDCSGTQTANWSADGHRLYSSVTAACANQIERSLVGLSMLVEGNVWIELQSVSLDGGEHRELLVRQYKRVADTETLELGFTPLEPGLATRAATARAGASGPLDVDDVLEAAEQAPVEIVEAAILESNSLFALDSGALIRLADAGVEERIIDLMVAISYPEQFIVDRGRSSGGGGGGGGGYAGYGGYGGYGRYTTGYYGYYAGSCWGPYYGPMYGPYGPGCDYGSPYYGYNQPYYGGRGGGGIIVTPSVPPTGSLYGGKVIRGRGYVTVTERPRTPSSSNDGVSGALRRAFGRDGSPGSSVNVGSSRSSSGSSSRSSVSRNGFRRSGSSAGSSSVGSSSSGSSSSGKASSGSAKARKAKPKGGSNS